MHDTYGITKFKFVDPTWCYPKWWTKDFCTTKVAWEGAANKLSWEAMVHASFIDKQSLELMKYSDCHQINVGCESGSQRILNDIRKGTTVNKIRKVFKWGKEVGLEMRAFFIIGMPNENINDVVDTIELIYDIDPDIVGITILCPYPGTHFYSREFNDVDWGEADEYSNTFWNTYNFSNSELHKIQEFISGLFEEKLPAHQKEVMNIV